MLSDGRQTTLTTSEEQRRLEQANEYYYIGAATQGAYSNFNFLCMRRAYC